MWQCPAEVEDIGTRSLVDQTEDFFLKENTKKEVLVKVGRHYSERKRLKLV